MSKIVVFGAAGNAGRRIVAEAANRGHTVVAVTHRGQPDLDGVSGVRLVAGDATSAESVRELAAGAEVLVVAIGGPGREVWRKAAETILTTVGALPPPRPRVIHMGGGATLTTADGTRFLDLPEFPDEYRDPAVGQAAALDYYLGANTGVDWTYFSPPPVEFYLGTRTGQYRTGHDQPVTDAEGASALSYEDFAVALVDEVEDPKHLNRRFTAAY